MEKQFLDLEGLRVYDELLKELIKNNNQNTSDALTNLSKLIEENKTANEQSDAALQKLIEENKKTIDILNGDKTVEGSIKKQVSDAVDSVIGGATEALDTLKEIEDWINSDESGTAALVSRVGKNEEDIVDIFKKLEASVAKDNELKEYIDKQDKDLWNSIGSIEDLAISALFLEAVKVVAGQSIANAIGTLNADTQKIVLDKSIVNSENLVVPAGVVIEANGATFAGDLRVAEGAVISNAIFAGKVTIE